MTLFFTGNHFTKVRSTDLLWHFLTPGTRLGLLLVIFALHIGCVTQGLEPGLTDHLGLFWGLVTTILLLWWITLLHKRSHACSQSIVKGHFLESDLAGLPEVFLTDFFLYRPELCHESIMACGNILVPALLDLLLLQLLKVLDFGHTKRAVLLRHSFRKVNFSIRFFLDDLISSH